MSHDLARGLRARDVAVLTVFEADRLELTDEEQLTFAAAQHRALFTCNVGDFARLHRSWMAAGRHHSGVILLTNQAMPVGAQIRALVRMASVLDPETMRDRIEFLANWWE